MTIEEMARAVEQITARGNHAEVKRQTDGTYTVYEVEKHKVTRAE